ncbi:MAG TPA: ribonuclease E/G [Alphaproteobacteria bacterium]|nr:ribonuclease E/G [Alphaproteobacteria bacterium]
MVKRMLVDATHAEETRVVVVNGNRLEEFDFETASKKQLKGNIYLAKVTRVEPSLQAAFIEYGGNRHGFLAFSEIHPDYYRIPVADREALLAQESASRREDDEGYGDPRHGNDGSRGEALEDPFRDPRDEDDGALGSASDESSEETADTASDGDGGVPDRIETVGGDDVEEAQEVIPPSRPRRSYKIQEVIKRRQIMLVQVTKEERGNKGAALTTYLSLAGRYCVLMPNTPRGGGISRKIANPKDRKKMKAILEDLFIPEGMAVILRTAGLERTKAEIKRDLDYLLRLWDSIRELTLQSTAPTLIHEEANLIKRAERDLYNKDIEEILVAGEEGYRSAKDFMRMLMPSHAKKVQLYKDPAIPLFHRYQVEGQIDAMHSQVVQLRSGGYIVINPTEALVAIDVNSGRSTRERNIEETAFKTNLEAAEEIARQLRLRDLAGLIVIDFIDMEEDRHNASVERKLKECMRQDRARIQLGRISPFGLLELSRQRLRPSLTETHFEVCRICGGTGLTRSLSSAALHVLRAIEEEGIRKRSGEIKVYVPTEIALYILNDKRDALAEIEQRYGFSVLLGRDDALISPNFRMEQVRARGEETAGAPAPVVDSTRVLAALDVDATADEAEDEEAERPAVSGEAEDGDRRRRRRSRRGRRRRGEPGEEQRVQAAPSAAEADEAEEADHAADESGEHDEERAAGDDDHSRRKRRRGKRGGRRRSGRRHEDGTEMTAEEAEAADAAEAAARTAELHDASEAPAIIGETAEAGQEQEPQAVAVAEPVEATPPPQEGEAETPVAETVEDKPKRKRAPRRRKAAAEPTAEVEAETETKVEAEAAAPRPARKRTVRKKAKEAPVAETDTADVPVAGNGHDEAPAAPAENAPTPPAPPAPAPDENAAAREVTVVNQLPEQPRRGWWRRLTNS